MKSGQFLIFPTFRAPVQLGFPMLMRWQTSAPPDLPPLFALRNKLLV